MTRAPCPEWRSGLRTFREYRFPNKWKPKDAVLGCRREHLAIRSRADHNRADHTRTTVHHLLMFRRWLITFAVAWLLGRVVTVLVAWCCTVRGGFGGEWEVIESPTWPAPTPEGWPLQPIDGERLIHSSIFGGIDFESAAGSTEDSYQTGYLMLVIRTGWPWRSMRTVSWYTSAWDGGEESYESEPIASGISVAPHRTRSSIIAPYYDAMAPMHLPAAPLWAGFVANSTLAAGLIVAVAWLFRFGTLQRARSRSRRAALAWIVWMLALGALASIVTALAMWSRWQVQDPPQPLNDGLGIYHVAERGPLGLGGIRSLEWPAMPPTSWPARPNVFHHYGDWHGITEYGYLDARYPVPSGAPDIEYERFNVTVCQAGWPMRCLESIDFVEIKRDLTWTRTVGPMGIELPLHSSTTWPGEAGAVLPLGPIWLGLLANTLFYAYLIALPVLSIRAARVVRRRRRGACESCGYSRAGLDASTPCPECGASNTLAS